MLQTWTTIQGNHMRHCAPLIAIALLTIWFGTSPHAQDINNARQLLEQALEVLTITPPQPEPIATPGAFTAALEAAARARCCNWRRSSAIRTRSRSASR